MSANEPKRPPRRRRASPPPAVTQPPIDDEAPSADRAVATPVTPPFGDPAEDQVASVKDDQSTASLAGGERAAALTGGEPVAPPSGDEPAVALPGDEPTAALPEDEPTAALAGGGLNDGPVGDEATVALSRDELTLVDVGRDEPTLLDLPRTGPASLDTPGDGPNLGQAVSDGSPIAGASGTSGPRPEPTTKRPARSIVATVLIVLASLLTPLAIVGGWSRVALTNTDAFVAAAAPLVRQPAVRDYLADQVLVAVEGSLDIEGVIGQVVDGLAGAVRVPALVDGLRSLEATAVAGVRSTIRNAAGRVVGSDAFGTAWDESLRLSHSSAIAALQGDPEATVMVSKEGLGLRIGPIVEQVKAALIDEGFVLANRIPAVDKTVVLVESADFERVKTGYQALIVVEAWLPYVLLLLLVAGIATAVRRHRAALWASAGLGLGALLVALAVPIGRGIATDAVPTSVVPTEVLHLAYDAVLTSLGELATLVVVVALVAVIALWLTGPFRGARTLRAAARNGRASLHAWGDTQGLSTGRFGTWLYAYRPWWRAAIGAVAVLALLARRPITPAEVATTAGVAMLVVLVFSLLARAPGQAPAKG